MNKLVYLNGEFLPLAEARIPVMDRGFLFGDGVYEVIPAYGGRLFRLAEHLQRLDNSLREIALANPLSHPQWRVVLQRLVDQTPGRDQGVYLQVTRGVAETRDHSVPRGIEPTVFAMANPIAAKAPGLGECGVAAITLEDTRWQRCDIKATTLLANVLLRREAELANAAEAILIRDGFLTEGAASNVFVVADGLLLTPPKSRSLLSGITRDLVLELAQRNSIPCAEQPVSSSQLAAAEEIWLTSSTRELLPVTRLDATPVADGRPGPLWRRMVALFQDYKQALRTQAEPEP